DLYRQQLDGWNRRDAAALYAEDVNVVGFDGTPVDGQAEIAAHFRQVFSDHQTATYVGKIREVRFLAPEVAVLRTVAGMVPPGQSDLTPNVNAVQTLVAVKQDGRWRIAVYQNSPAAFHGRPYAVQALTEELRRLL